MEDIEFLILGQGLAGSCLALQLAMMGKSFHLVSSLQFDSASEKAAGLMNPVTGRRMALTWNFEEVWPHAISFYADVFHFLKGEKGSFLKAKTIQKALHSIEEMNFLEAKTAWAHIPDLIRIEANTEVSPVFKNTKGWAITGEGYRLDVPDFLFASKEFFLQQNRLEETHFSPSDLKEISNGWEWRGRRFQNVVSCLGLGCPWISPELWAVKGQLFLIEGISGRPDVVQKTEHFFIPLPGNQVLAGSTYEREFSHAETDDAGFDEITKDLRPDILKSLRIAGSWAGIRPTSHDRRPIIREIKKGLFAINGLGTKGVSLAPFATRTLLDLIPD